MSRDTPAPDDAAELLKLREMSKRAMPGPWHFLEGKGLIAAGFALGLGPDDEIDSDEEGEVYFEASEQLPLRMIDSDGEPCGDDDAAFIVAAVNYVRAKLAAPSDRPAAPMTLGSSDALPPHAGPQARKDGDPYSERDHSSRLASSGNDMTSAGSADPAAGPAAARLKRAPCLDDVRVLIWNMCAEPERSDLLSVLPAAAQQPEGKVIVDDAMLERAKAAGNRTACDNGDYAASGEWFPTWDDAAVRAALEAAVAPVLSDALAVMEAIGRALEPFDLEFKNWSPEENDGALFSDIELAGTDTSVTIGSLRRARDALAAFRAWRAGGGGANRAEAGDGG